MLWGKGCPFSTVGEFEEKIEKWYAQELYLYAILILKVEHVKSLNLGELMGWS